ncbi:MAG: GIY-YIG nuclease family protein [Candidatus Omnitrophota bacterium]
MYIAECNDKTLYVGIALDADKRIKAHNTTNQCRYTRLRKPVKLVYKELCSTHGLAMKREAAIKSFDRKKKLTLFSS